MKEMVINGLWRECEVSDVGEQQQQQRIAVLTVGCSRDRSGIIIIGRAFVLVGRPATLFSFGKTQAQ